MNAWSWLTIHGMDGLEGHDLWFGGVSFLEELSEMGHIIVAENEFLGAAVSDALDHGSMVSCIRVDLTTWRHRMGFRSDYTSVTIFTDKFNTWLYGTAEVAGWTNCTIPGNILARVKRVESFATKQEVKRRAASLLWRSASSCSNSTWNLLVPEMFLVPPAPDPCFCNVSLMRRGEKQD